MGRVPDAFLLCVCIFAQGFKCSLSGSPLHLQCTVTQQLFSAYVSAVTFFLVIRIRNLLFRCTAIRCLYRCLGSFRMNLPALVLYAVRSSILSCSSSAQIFRIRPNSPPGGSDELTNNAPHTNRFGCIRSIGEIIISLQRAWAWGPSLCVNGNKAPISFCAFF